MSSSSSSEPMPLERMLAFNRGIVEEFRANGGSVTGQFAGAPLLLLTTTGAKSGEPRTTPLVHSTDGRRVVIIASYGGAPRHPAWFLNLRANPEVTVELPGETFHGRARIAAGEERARLFDQQAAAMPQFNEYREKTSREIPVVVIERV